MTECVANEFGRFPHAQFSHQARAMGFDGFDADVECDRDFLGRKTFGDLMQNFPFASRKQRERIFGGCLWAPHLIYDFTGHGRAEVTAPLHDFSHRRYDLVSPPVLEDVSVGTEGNGALDEGWVTMDLEQDHLDVGLVTSEALQSFESAESGHRDVEDDDIGPVGLDRGQNLLAITGLPHHFKIFLGFQEPT